MRVRHHELSPESKVQSLKSASERDGLKTHLARIEVGATELPRLLEAGMTSRVAEALKQIGYAHVTVDLQGYRRGAEMKCSRSNLRSAST